MNIDKEGLLEASKIWIAILFVIGILYSIGVVINIYEAITQLTK
jgi:hypothetical protein